MHETGVTLDTSTDMILANGQQTISVTVDTTYQRAELLHHSNH